MGNRYSFNKYVYFERWASYWHQINEVLELKPESVLVVGIGDGIVVDIFKKYIAEVKTIDSDNELEPDIVASVEKMPLADSSFEVILCAEVLEHLPFEKFGACLAELRRVTNEYVILSLPHFGPPLKFSFKVPFISETKMAFKIPFFEKHRLGGRHYWEIGKKGYSLRKITNTIKKYFIIKRHFIPFESQYHHFYILEKQI